ncbi:MAG: M20/M25/M40 family metallo-hydrolase [Clostridia bacterium]
MQDVYAIIEQNRETYIRWLQEICQQPSVADQDRGMKETADMVERFLREIGGTTDQLETAGYPVVLGTFSGEGERTLSFYNHYDVQPEDPLDLWESPPFAAEIRNGYMYARGVADNKGNLMARMAAVHAYLQARGKLPVGVTFIVEGEEEIGSIHLEELVEKYADRIQADGCVWEFGYKNADGRPQVSLGVKGMCYVELICRGANTDMHSAYAAVIENPAWRLIWALNTMKGPDERVLIDGFYDKVAALNEDDMQMLEDMIYNEADTLEQLGLKSFVLDLKGVPLKEKLIFQPTCTVCGFVSGYIEQGSKTVLPQEARVKLDFRLVPDQDPHDILTSLRKHLDEHGFSDIEILTHTLEHPARTPLNNPLAHAVIHTAADIYGMNPTIMPMSPGTGPMYMLCQQLGIPAVSVGVGHFASNTHAPNENISIEDYIQGIKHIAAVLEAFSKKD